MAYAPVDKVSAKHYSANIVDVHYYNDVDHCPYCNHSMCNQPLSASYSLPINSKTYRPNALYLFYQCKRNECQKCFIAVFSYHYNISSTSPHIHKLQNIIPVLPKEKEWPDEISQISELFSCIYNQALVAESHQLDHAIGPTYRKALEFLVKDYIISLYPDKGSDIKNRLLMSCIKTYITDESIKVCAERATWLGNDETHYVRKWEGKDISDLKNLIQLTVNHIQSAILTKKYLDEMPNKPGK